MAMSLLMVSFLSVTVSLRCSQSLDVWGSMISTGMGIDPKHFFVERRRAQRQLSGDQVCVSTFCSWPQVKFEQSLSAHDPSLPYGREALTKLQSERL
jgi:hypothetical protein